MRVRARELFEECVQHELRRQDGFGRLESGNGTQLFVLTEVDGADEELAVRSGFRDNPVVREELHDVLVKRAEQVKRQLLCHRHAGPREQKVQPGRARQHLIECVLVKGVVNHDAR